MDDAFQRIEIDRRTTRSRQAVIPRDSRIARYEWLFVEPSDQAGTRLVTYGPRAVEVGRQAGVSNFERLDRAVMRELDAESERLAAFHA